jgi:hypothetical protein
MKRVSVLFLCFSTFFFGLFSYLNGAELRGRVAVGGNFSLGIPLGDFSSSSLYRTKIGWGAGLSGEYFYRDNLSFGAIAELMTFKNKKGDSLEWFPGRPLRWDLGEVRVFAKYIFPSKSKFSPYAEFSAGAYKLQWLFSPAEGETAAKYQLKPGLSLGGGFLYVLSNEIFLQTSLLGNYIFSKDAKAPLINQETILEKNIYFISFKIGIVFCLKG